MKFAISYEILKKKNKDFFEWYTFNDERRLLGNERL
jgi:hypothetical protein